MRERSAKPVTKSSDQIDKAPVRESQEKGVGLCEREDEGWVCKIEMRERVEGLCE